MGIDLSQKAAPAATTRWKFRWPPEAHGLPLRIFVAINVPLVQKRLLLREGTIVDATLIVAPPSINNRNQARDPEMPPTKKGDQWRFGMKAHIDVNLDSELVHTVVAAAAILADLTTTHALLHGEHTVLGDVGYQGVERCDGNRDTAVDRYTAMKRGKRNALAHDKLGRLLEQLEQTKASLRAKVEHPFHVVKYLFKHRKSHYRGLAKNGPQLFVLFGMANLAMARRRLLAIDTPVVSRKARARHR